MPHDSLAVMACWFAPLLAAYLALFFYNREAWRGITKLLALLAFGVLLLTLLDQFVHFRCPSDTQ